jgi:hypothetical protein
MGSALRDRQEQPGGRGGLVQLGAGQPLARQARWPPVTAGSGRLHAHGGHLWLLGSRCQLLSAAWGADAPVGLDEREHFPASGAPPRGLGTYPGALSTARKTPPSSVVGRGAGRCCARRPSRRAGPAALPGPDAVGGRRLGGGELHPEAVGGHRHLEAGRGRHPPGPVDARQQHKSAADRSRVESWRWSRVTCRWGAREPGWPVSATGGSGRGSPSVAPTTAELRYW